jgi:hypothetical protein
MNGSVNACSANLFPLIFVFLLTFAVRLLHQQLLLRLRSR